MSSFRFPALAIVCLFGLSLGPRTVQADERLAGIACRSVHLAYYSEQPVAFYQEVTVEKSARGTYFMVCGWSRGYFGMQELSNGKKLILFSVWDSNFDDPDATAVDKRVEALQPAPGVLVKRFGNEGSGGQSFYEYDWKIGETYRFCVSCEPAGSRTAYSGWFFHPQQKEWIRLMTFSTITPAPEKLNRLYSFVEDFRRNRESTQHERVARFGNGWTLDDAGTWKAIDTARFTADSNPAENINAGIREGRFFLATGGGIENTGTPLRERITLPNPPQDAPDWKPSPVLERNIPPAQ